MIIGRKIQKSLKKTHPKILNTTKNNTNPQQMNKMQLYALK